MLPQGRWSILAGLIVLGLLGCSDPPTSPFVRPDAGDDVVDVLDVTDTSTTDTPITPTDAVTEDASRANLEACEMAAGVMDGTVLEDEAFTGSLARETGCFPFESGPTRYYGVVVPRDETLDVTVTRAEASTTLVPAVRILRACGDNRCITQAVGARSGVAASRWTNLSDTSQRVFIAVSPAQSTSDAGRYRMEVAVGRGSRNATCTRATAVGDGSSFTNLTFVDATDILQACTGSPVTSAGATLYYRATVPPGQLLTASTTPSTPLANSPVLRVITACGATACLAHSGATSTSGNTVRYRNDTSGPQPVLIAAQNYPATNTVPFGISFTLREPPANTRCMSATELTPDAPARAQNTLEADEVPMACTGVAALGAVRYHRVTIPAGQMLVASATRTGGTSNIVVRAYRACGGACTAATPVLTGATQSLRIPNATTEPLTLYLAVGSAAAGQSLTYDLTATLRPLAPNALCAAAEMAMNGTTLTNVSTEAAIDSLPVCMSSTVVSGPVRYYAVAVPANNALQVTLTPRMIPTSSSGTVRIFPSCEMTTCQASSPRNITPGPVTARLVNGAMPTTMIVVAGVDGAANTGTFDLAFAVQPAATNATCASAAMLTANTSLPMENLGDGRDVPAACTGSPTITGPGLWYAVDVPSGQTLITTARRPMGAPIFTPVIRAFPVCGATSCVSSSTIGAIAEQAALVYQNTTSMTERVFLGVNSGTSGVNGNVAVTSTVRAAATNGSCAAALQVTGDTVLRNQHLREGQFVTATCTGAGAGPGGFGLYYRTTVGAGQTLTIVGTRTAGSGPWWPVIEVLDRCMTPQCITVSPSGTTGVSTARYTNSGSAPREVFVAISPSAAVTATLVDLSFTLTNP